MSKIAQFVFHDLYSFNYSAFQRFDNGGTNDYFEYYDRNDIPIGPIEARTGGHRNPLYFSSPEGGSEYKKFETEEEILEYHQKLTFAQFGGKPDYVPDYKNYFKFPRKDFGKYSKLFHGMLKTSKITADFTHKYSRKEVQMKLDPNPNYRPCPPTCPSIGRSHIINKKIFDFNSTFNANIVIDGKIFENDPNFQNRIPLLNLTYLLDKNKENLILGSRGTKIYKNKWEFNNNFFDDFVLNPFTGRVNLYPFDRTRLNQPVITSPLSIDSAFSSDLGFMQGLEIGCELNLEYTSKDKLKKLNSSNAGDVTMERTSEYNLDSKSGFTEVFSTDSSSTIIFSVSLPSLYDNSYLYYIESTQEFMYFIDFDFRFNYFSSDPSFYANRPEHIISTNLILALIEKYENGPVSEAKTEYEKININLSIDGLDTVHKIEAIQIKNLKWEDKESKRLAAKITDGEEFNPQPTFDPELVGVEPFTDNQGRVFNTTTDQLVSAILDIESNSTFSNLTIHLNSWDENNFSLNNPFPAPLPNTNV
jgi:hypothetical protein